MQKLERILRLFFASRERSFLLVITFLALFIRVGIIVFASHPEQIISDPKQTLLYEHGMVANNLYTGHGFAMHWPYESMDSVRLREMTVPPKWEGAFLPIGNPYLLFFAYSLFGETSAALYAVMLFYAVVNSLLPGAIYRLALLLGNEPAARISALIAALFLPAAYAVATFSGSAIYQLLGVLILYYAVLSAERPTGQSFLWLGIWSGIMTLFRTEFFAFGFVLIAVSLFLARKKQGLVIGLRRGLVSAALCGAIIAPWTIRNYKLFHQFVPVISHSWYEIWRGENPYATGTNYNAEGQSVWVNPRLYPQIVRRMDSIPYNQFFEAKVDRVFKDEVVSFAVRQPGKFVGLMLKKTWYFFTIDPDRKEASNPLYWGPTLLMSVLTLLGMYRLMRDRTRRPAFIIVLLFFAFYIFGCAITLMLPRYQLYAFACLASVTGLGVMREPTRLSVLELPKHN